MSLVIVASVALDSIKTPFGKVDKVLGGSVMYASMSSKNFCHTKVVGVVGDDFPEAHLELLKENRIDTEGLKIVNGKTFHWKGRYNDFNRAETLETQLNVFADFNPELPESYRKSRFIFLGNIDPTLQLQVLKQMEAPEIVACDTMNFWISGKKKELLEVIKRVNILLINEDEIRMLTNEKNILQAAEMIRKLGPEFVIVKRGEYGSLIYGKDFLFFAPIFPVKNVIDPTGAGDSFAGGFMGYITVKGNLEEHTIRQAMVYGTVMASFDVESFSLEKLKKVDFDQIDARKEKIRESVIF
ncbi:MAG TPA: sugar kinase [Candidatus Cloacimonetes bacterium]|nr:sugar kinase [Candidatus Cloacimonadota bacterium]